VFPLCALRSALCEFPWTSPQKLLIKGCFNRHLSSVIRLLFSHLLNFLSSYILPTDSLLTTYYLLPTTYYLLPATYYAYLTIHDGISERSMPNTALPIKKTAKVIMITPIKFNITPTRAMSTTRNRSVPNTIALGGVATGNIKAKEQDSAPGIINKRGFTGLKPPMSPVLVKVSAQLPYWK
jgi:hypothetical protein